MLQVEAFIELFSIEATLLKSLQYAITGDRLPVQFITSSWQYRKLRRPLWTAI
jgi:hypothetical protein